MSNERRKQPRRPSFRTQPELSVQIGAETFAARLVDSNDEGFGLETRRKISIGSRIRVRGQLLTATGAKAVEVDGFVRWSAPGPNGGYFAGIAVDRSTPSQVFCDDGEQDYYEVLQVSPNADSDTIHRVFRALAQRFHPDNPDTGDEAWFKVLVRAYERLSDPQRRAAYDAKRPARQQARWKIFERAEAARGIEAERRKRHGILSLLYIRRANDPEHPAMGVHEFEQLLACPREHLEFAFWFLKENGWIARGDNGRLSITARGVERAEELGDLPLVGEDRMLEAPAPAPNGRG